MRPVVRDRWLEMTEPLEGGVASWYNDVRGLTTIAYGNLCNTPGEAAALAMVHPDGRPATHAEKLEAWWAVHNDPDGARNGWRHSARLTPLRLTRDGMTGLALAKLDANDRILVGRLPEWESYPACAQMAMHSLAWACGPHVRYPRLFAAAAARDWDECSVEIRMNEMTPEGILNAGLIPRNLANGILMRNAGRVEAFKLDPDYLSWTAELADGVAGDPTTLFPVLSPEPEEVTGSGGIIHPLSYDDGDDPPFEA